MISRVKTNFIRKMPLLNEFFGEIFEKYRFFKKIFNFFFYIKTLNRYHLPFQSSKLKFWWDFFLFVLFDTETFHKMVWSIVFWFSVGAFLALDKIHIHTHTHTTIHFSSHNVILVRIVQYMKDPTEQWKHLRKRQKNKCIQKEKRESEKECVSEWMKKK